MYIICFSLNLLFKFTSTLPGIMVMISFLIMNRDVLNASTVTGFVKNFHQALHDHWTVPLSFMITSSLAKKSLTCDKDLICGTIHLSLIVKKEGKF